MSHRCLVCWNLLDLWGLGLLWSKLWLEVSLWSRWWRSLLPLSDYHHWLLLVLSHSSLWWSIAFWCELWFEVGLRNRHLSHLLRGCLRSLHADLMENGLSDLLVFVRGHMLKVFLGNLWLLDLFGVLGLSLLDGWMALSWLSLCLLDWSSDRLDLLLFGHWSLGWRSLLSSHWFFSWLLLLFGLDCSLRSWSSWLLLLLLVVNVVPFE